MAEHVNLFDEIERLQRALKRSLPTNPPGHVARILEAHRPKRKKRPQRGLQGFRFGQPGRRGLI